MYDHVYGCQVAMYLFLGFMDAFVLEQLSSNLAQSLPDSCQIRTQLQFQLPLVELSNLISVMSSSQTPKDS